MLSKCSLLLLLVVSVSCIGQVSVIGGWATTAGPGAVIDPLISTPHIALPGTGAPVGAPLASAAGNDIRMSPGGMIYNPNLAPPAINSSTGTSILGDHPQRVPATEPFEFGIQRFDSGFANSGGPAVSLGQIAKEYRSRHHEALRTYTTDSIVQMNAKLAGNLATGSTALSPGAQMPSEVAPLGPQTIFTVAAENRALALPQSDRDAFSQATTESSPIAGRQHDPAYVQIAPAPSTTTSQLPAPVKNMAASTTSKISKTGSPISLLLLIGGAGLLSCVLYWLRR